MNRRPFAPLLAVLALTGAGWIVSAQDFRLPHAAASVKFAVIGDSGTGDRRQFEVADQMLRSHATFPFDRVIMLGDNIYGAQGGQNFDKKFALPYKGLLDAGVTFHATLGNHDSVDNRQYPLFHMGGERYYTHSTKNVRFFALDTDELDPKQLAWFAGALKASRDEWKICYFHHPLYSDGGTHGSDVNLRVVLEPLFLAHGVNVVFSGHDHIYERLKPQKGIDYFVAGSAGALRQGDLRRSAMTAAGFDQDNVFMLVEILGADLSFEAVSRTGQIVDSGTLHLPAAAAGRPPDRPPSPSARRGPRHERSRRSASRRSFSTRSSRCPWAACWRILWANTLPESYYRFSHALEFPVNEVGVVFFFALIDQGTRGSHAAGRRPTPVAPRRAAGRRSNRRSHRPGDRLPRVREAVQSSRCSPRHGS